MAKLIELLKKPFRRKEKPTILRINNLAQLLSVAGTKDFIKDLALTGKGHIQKKGGGTQEAEVVDPDIHKQIVEYYKQNILRLKIGGSYQKVMSVDGLDKAETDSNASGYSTNTAESKVTQIVDEEGIKKLLDKQPTGKHPGNKRNSFLDGSRLRRDSINSVGSNSSTGSSSSSSSNSSSDSIGSRNSMGSTDSEDSTPTPGM